MRTNISSSNFKLDGKRSLLTLLIIVRPLPCLVGKHSDSVGHLRLYYGKFV